MLASTYGRNLSEDEESRPEVGLITLDVLHAGRGAASLSRPPKWEDQAEISGLDGQWKRFVTYVTALQSAAIVADGGHETHTQKKEMSLTLWSGVQDAI